MQELRAILSGRVQMVMMRDFVARKARSLGITGYVKNLPSGAVEVVAQGEHEALDKLVEHMQVGSVFARVDNVTVEWRAPHTKHGTFQIAH